jgi:hypothetical protein
VTNRSNNDVLLNKNSVPTSQKTYFVQIAKAIQLGLKLFTEITDIYCENSTIYVNTLCKIHSVFVIVKVCGSYSNYFAEE